MSGESDDDSAHATPSDMTIAAQTSPRESWPNTKMQEEVRKIHYIDSATSTSASAPAPAPTLSATISTEQATAPPSQPTPSEVRISAIAPTSASASAPASAAPTPASTRGATPQTYARKRGRPRKHPLPDPNSAPPKVKRKLSADSAAAAAKKKANAAAAARSAASSTGSLLSVPDLGRLIPQGCSSENAQTFIQNNLRLFADLFVALQKQATTDNPVRDEPSAQLKEMTEINADQSNSMPQPSSSADVPEQAGIETSAAASSVQPSSSPTDTDPSSLVSSSNTATAASKVPGPSDAIREEIKKKMADVTKGREAIQAEMLQMRVDASFFENAQKTVDERIVVLRDRIAKHTALLQREREATRKAREATRQAKKDRKAREKSLKDSEREERRLAQTFMQLERDIAAEEEERRRLEEAESSDEQDDGQAGAAATVQSTRSALDQLGLDAVVVDASPSEATSISTTATPPVGNDTPASTDRAIGFSDEELAKVLGISTSELAGFSQTLELTSLQPPSTSISSAEADPPASYVLAPDQPDIQMSTDANTDSFDLAAFLEMASSFGAVASSDPATGQPQEN